jgi:hypothetical protein
MDIKLCDYDLTVTTKFFSCAMAFTSPAAVVAVAIWLPSMTSLIGTRCCRSHWAIIHTGESLKGVGVVPPSKRESYIAGG